VMGEYIRRCSLRSTTQANSAWPSLGG